jgi:hypothetical protein
MVHTAVWWGNVKKRDPGADGRIILKWVLCGMDCDVLDASERGGLLWTL